MAFKVKLPIMYLGAAYEKVFRWVIQDVYEAQTPVDMSGMNGRIQIRKKSGDTVILDISTENGMLIFDDTNRITIRVPQPITESLSFKSAQWDFLVWPSTHTELAEVLMLGDIEAQRVITDITP